MRDLVALANEQGKILSLLVDDDNVAAIRFYQQLGFLAGGANAAWNLATAADATPSGDG